ncbi:hypothetical protein F5144DRAFT_657627 [Chaetomium tenue]|uniref:Uncharacterized protein n=1 Tax=Chaetomium tenue TaxID=1854479 RepID=A0ACB7P102_9PEZI|nr:hypothetical protein F5144DRAFT_657627 [Chaetomium globosum]
MLPAELRDLILSHIVDLSDLSALVHASPVFYQQYRFGRERLLCQCLKRTLGSVFVDAYIRQASSRAVEQRVAKLHVQPKRFSAIRPVLRDYMELHISSQFVPAEDVAFQRCSIDDITNIASFYLGVVHPLMTDCATLFLQNLGTQEPPELGSLRDMERTRLLRALYRFQIFQDLLDFDHTLRTWFLGIFHPWELEEVHCIDQLVRAKHNWVFDSHITQMNPTTPKRKVDRKIVDDCVSILMGTISHGLPLFQALSRVAKEGAFIDLLQEDNRWRLSPTIPVAINRMKHDQVRGHPNPFDPLHHEQLERAKQRMPFLGDEEKTPPLSWVIIWGETYSNTYGDDIPSVLRDWGYVFWDKERLMAKGGEMKAVLQSAWLDAWPCVDPRDKYT